MVNKKLALIILINLILIFLVITMINVVNSKKQSTDTSEMDQKIEELSDEMTNIKVKVDQWDSLVSGEQSVDMRDRKSVV